METGQKQSSPRCLRHAWQDSKSRWETSSRRSPRQACASAWTLGGTQRWGAGGTVKATASPPTEPEGVQRVTASWR